MINADKRERWKSDIQLSVDQYNNWFSQAAPKAYRETRLRTIRSVEETFKQTRDLTEITPVALKANPRLLRVLRMCTAPPIARDRLVGLSYVCSKNLIEKMEKFGKIPPRMRPEDLTLSLAKVCGVISELLDQDLFPWIHGGGTIDRRQRDIAVTVVAERLCEAETDSIVRNAQESRQLGLIEDWLLARGYTKVKHPSSLPITAMDPGTFATRQNVPAKASDGNHKVNIPVDVAIQPHHPRPNCLPVLIEAKSAGDFTNVNKRRKEEGMKVKQLRDTYGPDAQLYLFLCGYFNEGYLSYSAAENLDWIWEHRLDDLEKAGV